MYGMRTSVYERWEMSQTARALILLGVVIGLILLVGCEQPIPPPTQQSTNVAPPANAPVNTNTNQSNSAPAETAASRIPITLPVVDALLADDGFLDEMRKSVQPTDEEFDKLKNAARDAVLKLDEGDLNNPRSTRAAAAAGEKKTKEILGDERGQKFLDLARQYWSGGDMEVAIKPNQVPTDTRIVINAPAYRMDLFQDGQLIRSFKIGIGYPEFPLPVGLRTAKEIIFNPTWTPPDEPWVKGEFAPGKVVEAGSKKNPLGVLKIPIGGPSLIHGGKQPNRLGTFASHGCVGLTDPLVQDFTAELAKISNTPLTLDQIKGFAKKRSETKDVTLGDPMVIEIRYETIVVEDGRVHVFRDVYERGTNTEENLNRVLETFGVSMNQLSPQERAKLRDALTKMAKDPMGKPVDEDANTDKKKSTSSKVTRTIKGEKEIVVDVAALRGKGFPSPVNINS